MNRRDFLATAFAGTGLLAFPFPTLASGRALAIGTRTLEVNGRATSVYSLLGPDGRPGLTLDAGTDFDVQLSNRLDEETLIHWHGLTPPWHADGVPDRPLPLMPAGETRGYRFPVGTGGTHWMHAHTLQEQNLLAAPLIVRTAEERAADEQEVVILLHDFSFTPTAELLEKLKGSLSSPDSDHGVMSSMDHAGMPGMQHGIPTGGAAAMDLNDIEYDAYLANDRTLDDPEVVRVDASGTVRLRIINGATATAFTIDLGTVVGTLIAVDGRPIVPVAGRRFPIAMGQRLDIRLRVPAEGAAVPVLALREGAPERTGVVLATAGAAVARLAVAGDAVGPALGTGLEARLRAAAPLVDRPVDRRFTVELAGDMAGYRWSLPGGDALRVRKGERVEIVLRNTSMMAHPMHLHGHHFQVVGLEETRFPGAMRDTVWVPPARSVTLALDADNPGRWAFHCHHLYHMASGMMAELAYEGVA